jgi:hypothetical protein
MSYDRDMELMDAWACWIHGTESKVFKKKDEEIAKLFIEEHSWVLFEEALELVRDGRASYKREKAFWRRCFRRR